VKIPPTSDVLTFRLELLWYDATDHLLTTTPLKTYSGQTAGWDRVLVGAVAPANTKYGVMRMGVGSLPISTSTT
jgi:hypothetical protein